MNNIKYLTGLEEKGSKKMRAVERTVGFLFTLILALLTVGCLVGNEDYSQANREVDEYQSLLRDTRLANDQLNREITVIYGECDALNSQLATLAALNIHDMYTEGLKRGEPAVVTPPPRVRPAAPRETSTSRPRVNTETPAPRRETDAQRGVGSQGSGGSPSSPAATPSPPSPNRTDGAIDWGF